jgi:hypothetical protein
MTDDKKIVEQDFSKKINTTTIPPSTTEIKTLPAPTSNDKNRLVISNVNDISKHYGIPESLANMFFIKMDNKLYIMNPGLLYLASKKGYSSIEVSDKFNEKTQEWEAECVIYPKLETNQLECISKFDITIQKSILETLTRPTNGKGRASKSNVKMTTMHLFLRELAQTRACNRALRNYTGYGGTSSEELPEYEDKELIKETKTTR